MDRRRLAGDHLEAWGFALDGARPFQWLVLHHSAVPERLQDWLAIRTFHIEVRGWDDIGYHAGIDIAGHPSPVQVGRPLSFPGAHSKGFNDFSLGMCCLGNFEVQAPSDEVWKTALDLSLDFMRWFGIPVNRVIGHREVYDQLGQPRQKTCPGALWNLEDFRSDLALRIHQPY